MNRTQMIAAIAERTEVSKLDVKYILDTFEETVISELQTGEPVVLSGFCKFARQDVAAKPRREVRNPATGEMMMAAPKKATKRAKITPLKAFKDAVVITKRRR